MSSRRSSASDGEIVESTHKANTASSHQRETGINNSSRGFGLDGASDWHGTATPFPLLSTPPSSVTHHASCISGSFPFPWRGVQAKTLLEYNRRDRTRSPSPYRRKTDRSPSPYRRDRNRSRSPSPYRRDKDRRGQDGKPAHSNKRKASPHRHNRPEKRYYSDGARHQGRQQQAQYNESRDGNRLSYDNANRNSHTDNERHNPVSSFRDGYEQGNGHKRDDAGRARHTGGPGSARLSGTSRPNGVADVEMSNTGQTDFDYTSLATTEQETPLNETREEKRRRWAAKRAQHAESTKLLHQALLTNTAETVTSDIGSPARPLEDSVSPQSGSPRLPDMDSVPASPDVMVVDKQENFIGGGSPAAGSPSAANYDPTQDMLDDRFRAEQKAQKSEMSASAYDETNPKILSTLPAEKIRPAKEKKKELDMFAFSDEEEQDEDAEQQVEEEQTGEPKGTVLDAKLLDNWDDVDGYYKIISNELVNAGRYRMIKGLGRGVFANVAQAEDVKAGPGQLVAIKIVRRNDAMRKASQKEMDFLQRLNEADPQDKRHIVRCFGSFDHKGHLCIVFEHMSKNLRDLLKEETSGHGLSLQAVKTYARQMFSGLKHLQDCQIVHADLKPDNILVSLDKKTVKLCDLGTAADKRDNQEPTPYLVSRFYRAPEIILGMEIGYAIDMWAIGCTIYELWTGKILFPGRSNNQMIKVIMECLGWPSEKLLRKGLLSGEHYEAGPPLKLISREVDQFGNVGHHALCGKNEQQLIVSQPIIRKIEQQRMSSRPLKTRVQEASRGITGNGPSASDLNDFVDLLGACLNWNFEKRIQPKEAINHKLFVKPSLAPRSAVVKPTVRKPGFGPRK